MAGKPLKTSATDSPVGGVTKRPLSTDCYFSSLRGKSIAVVGSADYTVNPPADSQGAEIDAHDVVIRFNSYTLNTEECRKYLGTRTDVWVINYNNAVRLLRGKVPRPNSEYMLRRYKKFCADPNKEVVTVGKPLKNLPISSPLEDYRGIISARPSSGLLCLYMFHLLLVPVDVYNFDFLQTTHYYDDLPHNARHDGEQERAFVEESHWITIR